MMRRWVRDGAHASKCTGRVQEASRGAVCDLRMHFAMQYFHCRCILHNAVGALVSFAPRRHFTAGAVCTCRCTSSAATIPRILSSERKTILVLAISQAHRRVNILKSSQIIFVIDTSLLDSNTSFLVDQNCCYNALVQINLCSIAGQMIVSCPTRLSSISTSPEQRNIA